jgi:membrane-associated phospholipid phosphatase
VDRLVAWFNAFAVLAWLPLAASPLGRWMAATHLAALALPLLLRRAGYLSRPVAVLLEVYPLLWIGAFWSSLGLRHELVPTANNDRLAALLDRALFGEHLNLSWGAHMPAGWLSETMHGFYFAYYALLVGIPALLLLSSCRYTVRDLSLRLAATYLLCFTIYLVFPVVGPLEMYPRFEAGVSTGVFFRLNAGIRGIGDSLGTAFPSSHVAGTVTLAWIAWRRCRRWIAWCCSGVAAMVTLATVYTQNHFAIDALAGLAIAALAQSVLVPLLREPASLPASVRHPGTFILFPRAGLS